MIKKLIVILLSLSLIFTNTLANLGGKLSSQADTVLIANESIVNISADIKADSLHVATKTFHSDIGITKLKKELDLGEEVNELVSNSSTIQANKDIDINTIANLNLIGTDVKAKGDINLVSTKGNVNILSKQSNNDFDNKTASGYLKTSQTNQTNSNLEAANINITSNSLHVKASNLSAKENINVNVKKSITIEAGETREYSDLKHKIKGSFLGGKLDQQDTIDNTTLIKSTLKAKNINLTANQINLIASQIKADEVKITTEVLRLISKKDSSYESHFKDSSGLMTRTIATKGHIKEKVVAAGIEVTKQLMLNNKDITNKLKHSEINDKKIQTRISQELQTNNIIKTLSSQYDLTHEQIELVKAYAKSKEWDESHTSLTAVGAIIVAIVVTVCTAGIGTGEAVAGLSAAQATATAAELAVTTSGTMVAEAAAVSATSALTTATITAAVTNAVVAGVATQVATAAITGESLKIDVGSIIKGAVSAGVLSYVNSAFTTDALNSNMNITKYAKNAAIRGTTQGAISELSGGKFEDGFKTGAILSVLNDGSLQMRQYVKENFDYGGKNGEAVNPNAQSAGVNGDKAKIGGSHFKKIIKNEEIVGKEVIAPFGGNQTGDRLIFGIPYDEDGLIDNAIEHFGGPHDFLSSWNYENIDGTTYLVKDGILENIASGLLLLPATPLATSTAIQNNIGLINTININMKEDKQKAKSLTELYYSQGLKNED